MKRNGIASVAGFVLKIPVCVFFGNTCDTTQTPVSGFIHLRLPRQCAAICDLTVKVILIPQLYAELYRVCETIQTKEMFCSRPV